MMTQTRTHGVNTRRPRWHTWGGLALATLLLVSAAGCGKGSAATQGPTEASRAASPKGPVTLTEKAIAQASREGKYSFVLFYRPGEQASEAMRTTFARAKGKLESKAVLLPVDASTQAEAGLVEKYGAEQAPLPLTLVIAPNGAIIRAFTKPVDEQALAGAFVSPKIAEVTKALQDKKVVALCLQGASTKHNRESASAAVEFAADPKLAGQGVVIVADPSREADLLKRCGLTAPPTEATIVLLAPPGSMVATVAGATTKEALLQKLQSASSCSSGSCGPSGCK